MKKTELLRVRALSLIVMIAMMALAFRGTVEAFPSPNPACSPGESGPSTETFRLSGPSDTEPYPFYRLVASGAIRLYQGLIGPARGTSCPMHPHCSQYAHLSFQNYSPLRAYVMTADRLLRCGHDLQQYSRVAVAGSLRYSDPVVEDISRVSPIMLKHGSASRLVDSVDKSGAGSAANRLHLTSETQESQLFGFARELHNDGDYDRAITEYRRLLSYYPDSHHQASAQRSLLRCYFEAGMYTKAISYGEEILDGTAGPESEEIRFFLGAAGLRSANYAIAHTSFGQLATRDGEFREKAIMAQGLTHAHELDWEAAERAFALIEDGSDYSLKARYCSRLCREGAGLGYKRPYLAGLAGIVPGLGYLYAGYYETALSALVVNGLFMWGTYEAFHQNHPGLGVTLAVFGFGWYVGNIYGSIKSATKRNIRSRDDILIRFDVGYML